MGELKEERLSEELVRSNIPLILNSYEDLFSDFDPRSFAERALSDDFLLECKKAVIDKEEGLELIFAVPRNKRSITDETKIKKRLKDHFRKHHLVKEDEIKTLKKIGWSWVGIGVLILVGVIYGSLTISNTFFQAVIAIFEIPSWFLVWEGLGKVFIDSKKKQPDQEFYHKMASATISFRSY